jgi:hypothetical protein
MTVVVPVVLCLLALVDAGFAGFRAATGRNARIRKRAFHLRAAWRGLGVGVVGFLLVAALLVVAVGAEPGRYAELVRAGVRMLQVLGPYAVLVVMSLAAYWLLPMRESTFVILVGLGPFTLVRPVVVAGAAAWAVLGSADWLVRVGALASAAVVLAVGPLVHRWWYPAPV